MRNVPRVALSHCKRRTGNGNIRAVLLGLLIVIALNGCAGLGDLCAAANGYQVIDTRTGNAVTIVPMKCAVLRGAGQ